MMKKTKGGRTMLPRVYVEITNICNMRCSFCHGHSRVPMRMTRDGFEAILRRLQGQTRHLYFHLMGEPLTHPELPLFLGLAKAAGFRCILTTNGTLLPQMGEAVLAAQPHKVSISLHSFEGGGEAAFRAYLTKTADFAARAAEQGTIAVLRLWNRGVDPAGNDLAHTFLRAHLPGDWVPNTRGFRIRDKLFLEWGDRFAWPDKAAPVLGGSVYCHALRDQVGILADGTVVPCCMDSDGVIALGNVFSCPLPEILSSPRAQAMTQGFAHRRASEDLCRRCSYAQRFL